MSIGTTFQGSLFAEDFLSDTITKLPDWQALDDAAMDSLAVSLRDLFEGFPMTTSTNECQTEDELIWPVLKLLDWTDYLRQQNLSAHGREDIPDGLLFTSDSLKKQANRVSEWRRYALGHAVVESKRWLLPLDRRSGSRGEETAPSTQMLRYLRRVDDLTNGDLRWGILTNGAIWRLYYQGARSVSEQFFEINLAMLLNLPDYNEGLFQLDRPTRRHWLKVFVLIFRCEAFIAPRDSADPRTFLQRAMEESRFYEQRVSASLSGLIFENVFPLLAGAIARAAPETPLPEVRDAGLILLYRILFILYAEDRNLLPVRDPRYAAYSLREKVRRDVKRRKERGDTFSTSQAGYWSIIDVLCKAIDKGDASIGLPPYNGGLFDPAHTPLLGRIALDDAIMAEVIDALSFENACEGRRYINYRDLGVRQLGSIYERLLEHEIIRDGDAITVRPSIFARRGTGSYYTPEDLVGLIVEETIEPLVRVRMDAFTIKVADCTESQRQPPPDQWMQQLKQLDPAEKLLELKVCDPAMGSGHFLVHVVDYLADRVIEAMGEAEAVVDGYLSPLTGRIAGIRQRIMVNAEKRGWAIAVEQLDDPHIVRRMVLKRCIHGVDKNPMAVELAKVALWLHTFTVGAPLSFLDHHLRCGDSLFGELVGGSIDKMAQRAGALFLAEPMQRATDAAELAQIIQNMTDAEIAEAQHSAEKFVEAERLTAPLNAILSLLHAFEWLNIRERDDKAAIYAFFDGAFGDPIDIALGKLTVLQEGRLRERFAALLSQARTFVDEERFFNWQVEFPDIWSNWEKKGLHGGFDAVVGNPPWDRMKLQQVEWFASRKRDIAVAMRAADRKRMIAELERAGEPLAQDFATANERAIAANHMARNSGDYPLLSGGDLNLYSLFVERAMTLINPEGMVGLLTPSGIASDKTAAPFFKSVATAGRLKALYDFENKKVFFPDVHASFKFCVFVASRLPLNAPAQCAFHVHDIADLKDPERCFPLTAADFARVNPNTGTAPIFRTRRDAKLTTEVYDRLPVLVDRSSGEAKKTWPVKYVRMFDMTNDSGLFRTHEELVDGEGAWPIGANRYDSPSGEWVPLYEGKMVQAFDHRAANIVVNPDNLHRPAQSVPTTLAQHQNPDWFPIPQYWVLASKCGWSPQSDWVLGFKEITAPTNVRTFIAALLPAVGFGNKVPVLKSETPNRREWMLAANLNATVFDFATRQKVQGQTLNLFILEQLPVVPLDHFENTRFGPRTAAEIVRELVLELTYTANDMVPFARDLGYVDTEGNIKPPFVWDEDRRLYLRAKLDAVFFHLYGVTNRDDVRYVYSTFPIVERQETSAYGRYRSRDLCLAWINALEDGAPDAEIELSAYG